jgi:O-antigen ligase
VGAEVQPAAANRPSPAGRSRYPITLTCAAVTCALLPWYTVRWHYGPLPTTLLETAILLTLAAFAIEAWRQRLTLEWRTPLTLGAVLFIIAGAISVVIAPDRRAALGLYRAYILEPIAFFAVLSFVVRAWSQARLILGGLAISGMAVCIPNALVVLQAIRDHTLNVAVAPPVVIYQTANAIALLVVPLIAVAAALVTYAPDIRDRLASAVFLLVAVPEVVLSFSRGGYLAVLTIGLLLGATHRARAWLVPATTVAAIAVSRVPPIASRLGHQVDLTDPNNSLDDRFRLWGATIRMLRDHPVFGTGLSGFKRTIDPYRNGNYTEQLIYPHNIVLNFWTETGILGLAAFAWILVQAVRVAWDGFRKSFDEWKPLHLGVLLAIAGILVHGLVDVPYWKNDLSLEFWVLLGLSWAGRRWATVRVA